MKLLFRIATMLVLLTACSPSGQDRVQRTYVIVHGATGGGWDWRGMDELLTARGHTVYRPTLTGLGERVHLSSSDIDLTTHINDIANVILFEDLDGPICRR